MTDVRFDDLCADFEDIQLSDLSTRVSQMLGCRYLEETSPESKKVVRGAVWGANLRPIVSLHVQITDKITTMSGTRNPINVHFLFLEASPQTYISEEALRAMGIEDAVIAGEPLDDSNNDVRLPVKINGYALDVARSPSDSHFAHLNILGEDLICASGANAYFGGNPPQFEITFP
ncbi:hypothetical protein BGX29_007748 [Mortierella sp. GBA35]|nr:hypothetical protein BGX23_003806 [Mortierella sp. AD031]KAF9098178.1 hypothetical protein BGX29_007748 [Mortierella sp. GBA35]KAG0214256.1 hypothetical protein BGX33_002278 [Mortierella sp. NVP41]